ARQLCLCGFITGRETKPCGGEGLSSAFPGTERIPCLGAEQRGQGQPRGQRSCLHGIHGAVGRMQTPTTRKRPSKRLAWGCERSAVFQDLLITRRCIETLKAPTAGTVVREEGMPTNPEWLQPREYRRWAIS